MKKILLVLVVSITTALVVVNFLAQNRTEKKSSKIGADSTSNLGNQNSTDLGKIGQGKATKEKDYLIVQEYLEAIETLARENNSEGIRKALSSLLSKDFEGDPNKVLQKLSPYLNHENKKIRYELAKVLLWTGNKKKEAIATLIDFVIDENEKPVIKNLPAHPSEQYKEDLRKSAADLLTNYRVEAAKDALWKAYQDTGDRRYLKNLTIFKDERVLGVALKNIEHNNKYHEHYEVLGLFKVEEARKPLELFYENIESSNPFTGRKDSRREDLAWSLYQITGKKKYFDVLTEGEFYVNNTFFELPDVLVILERSLREDDGSDLNAKGDKAFLSLLARSDGREIVENYLVEVFDEKIKSPLDTIVRYQVAAHLDSEKVNAAALRYEKKYGNGLWPHYSKRKGWPINNLITGFRY